MPPIVSSGVRHPYPVSELETSRFATIGLAGRDVKIHYHDVGDASAGAAVVVLLHGSGPGTTGWGSFHRNLAPLVDAGYRALLIDLPGWGRSDPVVCAESRPDLNARAVASLLDVLGIHKPVHVIGSSMGAHSSVALALAQPHSVDRLILVAGGTGGGSDSAERLPEGAQRMQRFYRSPSLQHLRELLEMTTASTGHLTDDFIRSRFDSITARAHHMRAFVASLDARPHQFPDVTSRLVEVVAPTLLVWGREDRVVPLEVGLRLLRGLKNAQMHVLGHCGHVPHQEHPGIFNRLALNYLAG